MIGLADWIHACATRTFRISAFVFVLTWVTAWWGPAANPRLYEFRDAKVEQTDTLNYWITPAGSERFHVTVCNDYIPPAFESGMTLATVVFADYGTCWSLDPNKHAGYLIKRDEKGVPLYEQ